MLWALLIAAALMAASGLALKVAVPRVRKDFPWDITWREYIAGLLTFYVIVMPVVFFVGKAWALDAALRYQEFYNGVETSATVQVENCRPGTSGSSASSGHSNCDYEYNTGQSYTFTEIYYVTVSDGCDSKGNCSSHQEPRTRPVTAYIYYPYANAEYTYAITDSLGGTYRFDQVYVKDGEGYEGQAIPADIPRGDPAEWLDAKQHLDAGDPRPVTRLFNYDNYILASQDELLKPFSQDVDRYLEEGILPDHTENINDDPLYGFSDSYANKVRFVGVSVADEDEWQMSLMSLDAALGSKLQGDLHLVLIDASMVDNPTTYMNALRAYWLGDDLGRRAIAKNAIIVVAGVQNDEVVWAQASTGMPFGNEVMLQGIQNFLPDTPLTPAEVIGSPRTVVTPATGNDDDTVTVTLDQNPGVLERIVLQDYPFERACMDCVDDEGGQIGYKNLVAEIQPKVWQWAIMITITTLLSLAYWYCAGVYELFAWIPGVQSSSSRSSSKSDRYDPYGRPYKTKSQRRDYDRYRY